MKMDDTRWAARQHVRDQKSWVWWIFSIYRAERPDVISWGVGMRITRLCQISASIHFH